MSISSVCALPSLFCQPEAAVTCFANELLLEIFSRLKAQDLLSATSTCKRFYEMKKDRSLWEALFKQDFPRLIPDPERSFFLNMFVIMLHGSGAHRFLIFLQNLSLGFVMLLCKHCLRAISKSCLVISYLNEDIRIWDLSIPVSSKKNIFRKIYYCAIEHYA